MRIKCEYDCSLMILEYSVIGTYRYTRYKKDSWNMAFRRALSINSLRRAILAFVYVYMCSFTGLSNFDTPGDTTRSDTNWFSRGVQPIFRDICFSCSRAITIHQVIAIFFRFHRLGSYRSYLSLTRTAVAIPNHKTNSECSGSGLASFKMILVESNIIVLGLAGMNVYIVGK